MGFLRILTLALFSSLLALPLAAQQSDQLYTATHEQLEVTKTLVAAQAAWNKGDLDGYMSYFKSAPDTVAMLATPVRGVQSIHNAYLVNFPNAASMGNLDQTEVYVREMGENFAIATGKYLLNRDKKVGGPAEGYFTDIFEKTADGWKIIYSATS